MFPDVSCTITGMEKQDWERLGQLVVQRRIELGMRTREALADQAKLSTRLLADIEKGRRTSYSPGTMIILEQALQWHSQSVRNILDGGNPDTLEDVQAIWEEAAREAKLRPVPPPAVSHVGVPLSMIALTSESIDEVQARTEQIVGDSDELQALRHSVRNAQLAGRRLLNRALRFSQYESPTEGDQDEDITQSWASSPGTVDSSASGGSEGRTPPMNAASAATEDKPEALIDEDQGSQADHELAARKGETEDEIRERLGIPYE